MLKWLLGLMSFLIMPLAFGADIDGSSLSLAWGIPFAGLLLSIALFPLFAGHFWHHHFGKVALFWALVLIIPLIMHFGANTTGHLLFHAAILEYVPFILLLLALYVTSGGIVLNIRLSGSPYCNTLLLLIGSVLASIMGTTGTSMLLIRPLLRATQHRQYRVHTFVFFIFLVANIGGSLSPLGDPPLFLGFLKGVSFFWPLQHLWLPTSTVCIILLTVYFLLDSYYYRKEGRLDNHVACEPQQFSLAGYQNIALLVLVVISVLLSGLFKNDVSYVVYGTAIPLNGMLRDIALLVIAIVSYRVTSKAIHEKNSFSWFPMIEVGKLFAAIFATIIPVIAILKAGKEGHLSSLIQMVTNPETNEPINLAYFWITGTLSSFLDNAPTYLVFFNMAGGDAATLMSSLSSTLAAISMGAVYMGAMTYIGNAPNFMVRSIAIENKVNMPSFFGYMLWSCCILLPVFALVTFVMFY